MNSDPDFDCGSGPWFSRSIKVDPDPKAKAKPKAKPVCEYYLERHLLCGGEAQLGQRRLQARPCAVQAVVSLGDPWHLVRIRMQILGFWLTDPDADPGGPKIYGSGTLVNLHHSSKIKSHKEVTEQQKSRFFLLFLLDDGRSRIQSRIRPCD